jgi:hypothetical protein
MPPRSAFGEEMHKRRAHLEALPAWQLWEDLEALNRCFYIFNKNAKELADQVGRFLNSSQLSQELSDDYVNELVRLLHNYLTSVTSLVDFQRVVMRHRWPGRRGNAGICASCGRPMPSREDKSEFEANDYSEKLAETFETGEAVFMTKLRNYCTHYSIPLPNLGTTMTWEQGMPAVLQVNTLQLVRDKLLRWDGWTAPAKQYLDQQADNFDLAPIIERYVNAAGKFASWFWAEINARSAELIDEITTKATELKLWQDEHVGIPDWLEQGDHEPPPGWNGIRWRTGLREARYRNGTRGFRVWEVDINGTIVLAKDDDWTPLPSRYHG